MAHDVDVVACNVVVKDFAGRMYATNSHIPNPSGEEQISSVGRSGLEKVRRIGLGIMLTKADVYSRIRFPWFGHRWYRRIDKNCWLPVRFEDKYSGEVDMADWRTSFEDWWLCERFEEAGIDVQIDHDMSQKVGHRGSCVFMPEGVRLG